MEKLDSLLAEKETYDSESQAFLASLQFVEKEIGELNSMKRSAGWHILEKKIREELQQRIQDMVKNDPKITVLLSLLNVADTKTLEKTLQEEISKIIPE